MNRIHPKIIFTTFIIAFLLIMFSIDLHAQIKKKKKPHIYDTLYINYEKGKLKIELNFLKGQSHNHPTFAIWIEDKEGSYVETLFVTEYISKGIFGYSAVGNLSWKNEKGEALRPAALPYWSHKRNVISRDSLFIPTPENPVPDAISCATPKRSFILKTATDTDLPLSFILLLEINQTWDWNEFWTNNKYPNSVNYKTSAQPSIIYSAEIDLSKPNETFQLQPIGHGHYSGKDGILYDDLSSFTTALSIAEKITISIYN